MLKFYQKKKTSQVLVGKQQKIGIDFLLPPLDPTGRITPRVELPLG